MLTKEFFLAGNAIFTVQSKTGQHYTFKISKKEASGQWPETYFVNLLTGPDNLSDYTYLGILNSSDASIRLTGKSAYDGKSLPVRVIRWALGLVWTGSKIPEGYQIHHVGRCGRCGRALTHPESCHNGFGPECIKKI